MRREIIIYGYVVALLDVARPRSAATRRRRRKKELGFVYFSLLLPAKSVVLDLPIKLPDRL